MKDNFLFYSSFYEALLDMPDKERLILYDAISLYGLKRERKELSGICKTIFTLIEPQLKANWRKYDNGKLGAEYGQLGKEHGFKGGRPKKETPQETPQETPHTQNEKPPQGKGEGKGEGKGDKFIPPTIDDVITYFKDNGYSIDVAKNVFHYYNDANWVDSKGNKVKNWKQKIRGVWFKEENKIQKPKQQQIEYTPQYFN